MIWPPGRQKAPLFFSLFFFQKFECGSEFLVTWTYHSGSIDSPPFSTSSEFSNPRHFDQDVIINLS